MLIILSCFLHHLWAGRALGVVTSFIKAASSGDGRADILFAEAVPAEGNMKKGKAST